MKRPGRFRHFAAARITRPLAKLESHLAAAAKDDDPEHVHQLRVASRRLRAVLQVFRGCFAEGPRWARRIRELTRVLGPARDLDVQLLHLESLRKSCRRRNLARGLDVLAEWKRAQRARLDPELRRGLDALRQSGILPAMAAACADAAEPPQLDATQPLATRRVAARLRTLRAAAASLDDPADREGHHRMRIAAKKLRYTAELFAEVYPHGLDAELAYLKRLQDLLGELHDCDVWLAELPRTIRRAQRRGLAPAARGLEAFLQLQQDRRAERFAAASQHWTIQGSSLAALEKPGAA